MWEIFLRPKIIYWACMSILVSGPMKLGPKNCTLTQTNVTNAHDKNSKAWMSYIVKRPTPQSKATNIDLNQDKST